MPGSSVDLFAEVLASVFIVPIPAHRDSASGAEQVSGINSNTACKLVKAMLQRLHNLHLLSRQASTIKQLQDARTGV